MTLQFRKPWIVFSVVAIVTGALFSTGALLYVRQTCKGIVAEATAVAHGSATSFANATSEWILSEVDHQHLLNRVVDVMFGGNTLFIQVQRLGKYVVDARAPGWDRELPDAPAAVDSTVLRSVSGRWVLDTLVTFPELDPSGGTVRIGTAADGLAVRFEDTQLAAALASSSAWVVGLILTVVVLRIRHAHAFRLIESVPTDDSEQQIVLADHPLTINSRAKSIAYLDREVSLSPKPFLLLELLAREHGRVFTDSEIIEHVWTDSPYVNSNDVRQCVYRLRCQLNEIETGLGRCIANVKGFGYRFDVDKLLVGELSGQP